MTVRFGVAGRRAVGPHAPETTGLDRPDGARRSVIAALAGNLAITLMKGAAAVLTGSGAMVAETAHSAADTMNEVLLFVGVARSGIWPSEEHPLGYGKERYFWALVVALLLFFGGGIVSVLEAYDRYVHPRGVQDAFIAFAVLGGAAVFEGLSFSVALRELRRKARSAGVPLFRLFLDLGDPALRTVLFEDSVALVGLAIAAAGLALTVATGDHRPDALASATIGLLLIVTAFELTRDARGLIIGEAAPPALRARIRATIERSPYVREVVELLTVRMGVEQLLVIARVSLDGATQWPDVERHLEVLNARLRREHPEIMRSFLEPALTPISRLHEPVQAM